MLGLEVDDVKAMGLAVETGGGRTHAEYHDIQGGVVLSVLYPDGQIIQLTQRGVAASEL